MQVLILYHNQTLHLTSCKNQRKLIYIDDLGYAIHKNRDDEKKFRRAFKIEQEKQNEYTYTFCLAK